MPVELSIVRAAGRDGFMATARGFDATVGAMLLRRLVGPAVRLTRRRPQQLAQVAGAVTGVCWAATATGIGLFTKVTSGDALQFVLGVLFAVFITYSVVRRSRQIEAAIGQGPGEGGSLPAALAMLLMSVVQMRRFTFIWVAFNVVLDAASPQSVPLTVVNLLSLLFLIIAYYFVSTVMTPPPRRQRVRVGAWTPITVPNS